MVPSFCTFCSIKTDTLWCPPRLEITCKWNKNCTEKIMVPLKFLRKRSSRFGATCWGITTHQANRADGLCKYLCKYCKGLPYPPAQLAWWVAIPQHVAPKLELLFPKYFSSAYGILVQFFYWPNFSTGLITKIPHYWDILEYLRQTKMLNIWSGLLLVTVLWVLALKKILNCSGTVEFFVEKTLIYEDAHSQILL